MIVVTFELTGEYKYFSDFSGITGAEEVYINTAPAPEKCV